MFKFLLRDYDHIIAIWCWFIRKGILSTNPQAEFTSLWFSVYILIHKQVARSTFFHQCYSKRPKELAWVPIKRVLSKHDRSDSDAANYGWWLYRLWKLLCFTEEKNLNDSKEFWKLGGTWVAKNEKRLGAILVQKIASRHLGMSRKKSRNRSSFGHACNWVFHSLFMRWGGDLASVGGRLN